MIRLAPLALTVLLAACGTSPGYLMTLPPVPARISTAADTIMVREVSMPDYAADDYMALQSADGSVDLLTGASATWGE